MNPKVSVVVPSYNHARFIPACLESVLCQTFSDWEMVVVDDGSTDDSVAKWSSTHDSRVRVEVNEGNLGTYGTQIRGVEHSRGELIAILNSDDLWEPEKLTMQVAALDSQPDVSACYCLGWRTDESGNIDSSIDPHGDWPHEKRQRLLPFLLEQNRILASGVVFRKDAAVFDASLRYSGDWIALLHACFGSEIVCVPERMARWRIHGESSHKAGEAVTLEEIRVRSSILAKPERWMLEGEDRDRVWKKLGQSALHLAALCVLWNRPKLARGAALFAVRHSENRAAALRRFVGCALPSRMGRRRMWPGTPGGFDGSKVDALLPVRWRFEKP